MKCVICQHGKTSQGFVTVTLERDSCIIIFKQVPASICENCGEYYLSEAITEEILNKADDAVSQGAEVEIIRYVA
jgi:YgiT-type zinc finger domain-containing protein